MISVYSFMDPREPNPKAATQPQLDSLLREKEFLLQEVAEEIEQLCQQLKLVNENVNRLLKNHAQIGEFSDLWAKLQTKS